MYFRTIRRSLTASTPGIIALAAGAALTHARLTVGLTASPPGQTGSVDLDRITLRAFDCNGRLTELGASRRETVRG